MLIRNSCICILFVCPLLLGTDCRPHGAVARKYEAGQVWRYKTRAGEEQSRLILTNLVKDKRGDEVVFVCITNVNVRVARDSSSGREIHSLSSVPFTARALDASVSQLVTGGDTPRVDATRDLKGPTVEQWQRAGGQAMQIGVADYVNSILPWSSPLKYEPLRAPSFAGFAKGGGVDVLHHNETASVPRSSPFLA